MAQHIFTGSGAPTAPPTKISQHYIDTTNKVSYISTGVGLVSDWKVADASAAVSLHEAASNPHPQYLTQAEGDAAYDILGAASSVQSALSSHTSNTSNPHATTKTQLGLGNVQDLDQTNPANISQTPSYRFVTDSEKSNWDSKATTGYVDNAAATAQANANSYTNNKISDLVASSPAALDTLNELAAALGNDPNFATTITNQISGKANTVHSHEIDDVNGLESTLDEKAHVSHTHAVATQAVYGFMSAADKTKLDNFAQEILRVNGQDLYSTSNTVLTNIPNLALAVESGFAYKFNMLIRYSSNNASNGIAFAMTTTNGADGEISYILRGNTSATAGVLITRPDLNSVYVLTATPAVNKKYLLQIEGIFFCTSSGDLVPQFRSEVNGNRIDVYTNSILEGKVL